MHDAHTVHEDPQFDPNVAGAIVEDVEGLEQFSLTSVGIDIGSSTSHLVFSHLTLRRKGSDLSAQFEVAERGVLYRSPILLTPYVSGTLIDTERLRDFIHAAYREAGFSADDVDTGAVVITGEALKKENARPILEFFAQDSGKFICASAGPNHEALLAAHGSGAVALSRNQRATVLNVDLGGGTAKLSLIRNGQVAQTAAVELGARLIAFDRDGFATRVENPARRMARALGYDFAVGRPVAAAQQRALVDLMVDLLFEIIDTGPSPLAGELLLTPPLRDYRGLDQVDCLVFSGGVSEYVYGRERASYGDLGPLFGQRVHARLCQRSKEHLLREPSEGIRATVIGAGEYTVQASGNTSYISSERVLPVFGLKVVKAVVEDGHAAEAELRAALARFDLERFTSGLALALSLAEPLSYRSLRRVAEGIAALVQQSDSSTAPLFLLLDADVARSLGGILKEELDLPRELVALDGIEVGDLDYVDIGCPMGVSESLPVTVKSLMFP
ncbi:MAG: ethanolamine ammonia-lyase reactivating factor EutA [Chloroflexi bacterium]|nr:ethanolamine ammonia-lyase reactivating factor EutA [Chloroflexota bacterium]